MLDEIPQLCKLYYSMKYPCLGLTQVILKTHSNKFALAVKYILKLHFLYYIFFFFSFACDNHPTNSILVQNFQGI